MAGILSRILHKDEKVIITLFGFSSGQELSARSAPTPAILYFLDGNAEVQLNKVDAQPGSFIYMPPMLTHSISAKSPVLLIQQWRRIGLGSGKHLGDGKNRRAAGLAIGFPHPLQTKGRPDWAPRSD